MLYLKIQEVIIEMVNIYYIITVCVNVHPDRGRLYYCCQYANTRDDCHFFKWAFPEGFGDSNTYQEPEEIVQRRMYGVDEDFKHILIRIEFMQKVILVGLLLFFVLCLKIA